MRPAVLVLIAVAMVAVTRCRATEPLLLVGAGGTGPATMIEQWIQAFRATVGVDAVDLSFGAVGSGSGKAALWGDVSCESKFVPNVCPRPGVANRTSWGFGGGVFSDADYVDHADLELHTLPGVAGASVFAYGREVLGGTDAAANLNITMQVAAQIFNGSITFWNDTRISELNPRLALPGHRITVVARADKSGTTETVTGALRAGNPSWAATGSRPRWPMDGSPWFRTADGDYGVAIELLRTPFSLGYLNLPVVEELGALIAAADIADANGVFVRASLETVESAMANTAGRANARFEVSLLDPPPPNAYYMARYIYWYLKFSPGANPDCDAARLTLDFVEWSYTDQAKSIALAEGWIVPPETTKRAVFGVLESMQCTNEDGVAIVVRDHVVGGAVSTTLAPVSPSTPELDQTTIIAVSTVMGILAALVLLALLLYCQARRKANQPLSFDDALADLQSQGIITDSNRPREIRRGALTELEVLGQGAFGVVTKCWLDETQRTKSPAFAVACKTMSGVGDARQKQAFVQEATIMAQLVHENVIGFIGVVTAGDPMIIVLQYAAHGSLDNFLKARVGINEISLGARLQICQNIASGMAYLCGEKNLVHRDLAARNVLLTENSTPKISDFGFTREVDEDNYYTMTGKDKVSVRLRWVLVAQGPSAQGQWQPSIKTKPGVTTVAWTWMLGRPACRLTPLPLPPPPTIRQPPPPHADRTLHRCPSDGRQLRCWKPGSTAPLAMYGKPPTGPPREQGDLLLDRSRPRSCAMLNLKARGVRATGRLALSCSKSSPPGRPLTMAGATLASGRRSKTDIAWRGPRGAPSQSFR